MLAFQILHSDQFIKRIENEPLLNILTFKSVTLASCHKKRWTSDRKLTSHPTLALSKQLRYTQRPRHESNAIEMPKRLFGSVVRSTWKSKKKRLKSSRINCRRCNQRGLTTRMNAWCYDISAHCLKEFCCLMVRLWTTLETDHLLALGIDVQAELNDAAWTTPSKISKKTVDIGRRKSKSNHRSQPKTATTMPRRIEPVDCENQTGTISFPVHKTPIQQSGIQAYTPESTVSRKSMDESSTTPSPNSGTYPRSTQTVLTNDIDTTSGKYFSFFRLIFSQWNRGPRLIPWHRCCERRQRIVLITYLASNWVQTPKLSQWASICHNVEPPSERCNSATCNPFWCEHVWLDGFPRAWYWLWWIRYDQLWFFACVVL